MTLQRLRRLLLALAALVLLVAAVTSVREALPPSRIVIETGPVGGSYHRNALLYARKLEAAGLQVEIRPLDDTLQIAAHVNDRGKGADIGFSLQPLEAEALPNVRSAGVVELQPLFILANVGLGRVESLVSLRGKRLVMPVEQSVTADTTRTLLALYGITPQNTRFTYLPIARAAQELREGKHDAGFFMLAPANPLVRELVKSDLLALVPLAEAEGASRSLAHLRPGVLPLGGFDLQDNIPPADVHVVSGKVNVLVKDDINPAVLYRLLDAMKAAHQGQTLVSATGEFPTLVGTALEAPPLAVQWARNGTPWLFTRFGPVTASLVDKYWLVAVVLVLVSELYRTSKYLYELGRLGMASLAVRILLQLQRRSERGQPLGRLSRRLFGLAELLAVHQTQHAKALALLEQVRPQLALPPSPSGRGLG